MFWTAVIWGLGVSLGTSVGMMAFVVIFAAFKHITESEKLNKIEDFHERSHQALVDRNDLSKVMIRHMAAIAAAAERCDDSVDRTAHRQ